MGVQELAGLPKTFTKLFEGNRIETLIFNYGTSGPANYKLNKDEVLRDSIKRVSTGTRQSSGNADQEKNQAMLQKKRSAVNSVSRSQQTEEIQNFSNQSQSKADSSPHKEGSYSPEEQKENIATKESAPSGSATVNVSKSVGNQTPSPPQGFPTKSVNQTDSRPPVDTISEKVEAQLPANDNSKNDKNGLEKVSQDVKESLHQSSEANNKTLEYSASPNQKQKPKVPPLKLDSLMTSQKTVSE